LNKVSAPFLPLLLLGELLPFWFCYVSHWLFVSLWQVGVLNVDGFYDGLLAFFDTAVREGFITPANRHIVVSAPTAVELLNKLRVSRP
jgi:hypothetical protein